MEDYRLEQTGQEVQRILNGAAMDANLQEEVERATEAEGRLQDNIDAEERARQDADGLLQQGISDEENRAKRAEEANAGEIEGIKALIPSTASEANKLADTNYVNSSIQTATAEYRGDYNVVTDLHLAIDATHAQIETLLPTVIAEADKNDYCYVMIPTNAQTPTEIAKIERYKMTSEGWKFEYDVNNSTFTAEEWAAIKSGITSGLVGKLNALPTNADLLLLLAGKQDMLTFDATPVPESNNPVKSGGVYSAIDDEKTARLNSDTAIHAELDGLQAKVPATASSDNKLVDQNQMNSSISTATATYRGDWNVVSDLHLAVDATRAQIAALLPTVISTADNNDYCYVEIPTSAETPTQIERVERYKFNGTAWAFEYVLNNSGFTAAQWAAINSMITSGLVAKLTALPTNADLLAMFATKQDVLTFDSTPTENSTNPVTSGGVFAADKALSDAIEAILLLIPSAATSLNKLVDTALMNSSISTATATFRGTYNLVSDLSLGIDATEQQIAAALALAVSTADNNDYAFVQIPTSAETPTQIARTDRYKYNGTAWAFEYTLNTSGFTADQWAAINSTITSTLVAKLSALPTAAELQEALGVLTSGITAINQKIPSTASQSNKLVDNASMESYIAQVINILDASFNATSTDGHITLHITQVDGVITSVQVQSTDIASAADLTLVTNRVTTAEGNITSLTGRMGTAETNIANLQQLYNNLQQSKPVPVTSLPSSGQQQGVIYRLAGTTSYSDYMWNGSSWVLMATYDNATDNEPIAGSNNLVKSGGVIDFSIKNIENCIGYETKFGLTNLISNVYLSGWIDTSVDVVDVTDVHSHSYFKHVILNVSNNDLFFIMAAGGIQPLAWCFIDSQGNRLKYCQNLTLVEGTGYFWGKDILSVPANATKLVINFHINYTHVLWNISTSAIGNAYRVKDSGFFKQIRSECGGDMVQYAASGWINTSVSPVDINSVTSHSFFMYIVKNVNEGDLFYIDIVAGAEPLAWCFIDDDGNRISCCDNSELEPVSSTYYHAVGILVTPAHATKLVINYQKSYTHEVYDITPATVGTNMKAYLERIGDMEDEIDNIRESILSGSVGVVRPVIWDNDLGWDIDDCVAGRILAWGVRNNLVDLIGVVLSSNNGVNSVSAMDGLLCEEGIGACKIGIYPTTEHSFNRGYHSILASYQLRSQTEQDGISDIELYRRALSQLPDGVQADVIITGYTNSFARFMQSPADAISQLTGLQLANTKIRRLWVMGGNFKDGTPELNFETYPSATEYILQNFTGDMYVQGHEIAVDGTSIIHAGADLSNITSEYDLLYQCLYDWNVTEGGNRGGCYAYDPMVMLAAIDNDKFATALSYKRGVISFDTTNFTTSFTETADGHHYVASRVLNIAEYTGRLDGILNKYIWPNHQTKMFRL